MLVVALFYQECHPKNTNITVVGPGLSNTLASCFLSLEKIMQMWNVQLYKTLNLRRMWLQLDYIVGKPRKKLLSLQYNKNKTNKVERKPILQCK